MTEPTPEPSPKSETLSPGATIGVGLGILGFAALLFFILMGVENTGDSLRVPWWLAVVYWIGGKWTVGIGLGAFGLLVVGCGIWEWFSPTPRQTTTPPSQEEPTPGA